MIATKNIYTIYASDDKDVLLYLLLYLKPLEKDLNVAIWHDDPIYPEQPWKPQSASRLNSTDIFLLLVSNAFMHSEFIKQDEFKMILGRNKENKSIVIPILLDDFSRDTDFNSDDYNFNLNELHFFPEDEKPISDWNSADRVFKEVIEYIKREITSFTENVGEKEPSKKNEMKTMSNNKVKQIAIDFFDDRTVNSIAEKENHKEEEVEAKTIFEENSKLREELEGKKVIKRETRQRKEAEIRKRIEKEKRPKENAKKDKKNEEEGKAIRMALEENRAIKEAKVKKEEKARINDEIALAARMAELEKRLEATAARKRVMRKNRLAVHNYQFKPTKMVKSKRAVHEESWRNEEVKTPIEVEVKSRVELTKPEKEPQIEKRLGEVVAPQKRVTKNNRLARYNYQFKTTKVVVSKRAVQEEKWENIEVKDKNEIAEKGPLEITKSSITTELEKRQRALVAALKRFHKKISLAVGHFYQFITAKVVEAKRAFQENRKDNEETKAQIGAEVEKHVETTKSGVATELEKRQRAVVAALKRFHKKISLALGQYYQLITAKVAEAKRAVQENRKDNEETKAQIGAEVEKHVETRKSGRAAELEKKLGEVVVALKRVTKKIRLALGQYYQFITAKVIEAKRAVQGEREGNEETKAQFWVEVKRRVETTKSGVAAELEKRLGEVVAALKGVTKKIRRTAGTNYQFKSVVEADQNPVVAKKKNNTKAKRRIHPGFLIAALVGCGLLIYVFTGDSEKQSTTLPDIETTEVVPDAEANVKTNSGNQVAAFLKLRIGDTYEGGLIFAIDQSNKTGKIVYPKDAGPMKWTNAMKIHEQLGEGWRLPTMDELQLMYQNIGQGATNSGQFANELYWSATPYDKNQARLLRFRDGNRSYHYGNDLPHRKFQVRAIRDFSR